MVEVAYIAGGYDMVPLGRGKALIGMQCTVASSGLTVSTGLKRIVGLGYMVEDTAVDADTQVLAFGTDVGELTVYTGDAVDHTAISVVAHLLITGHLH